MAPKQVPIGINAVKRLFDKVICWENLLIAHRKAAKGKRGRSAAARFEYNLTDNLLRLQQELTERTYQPGEYRSFFIYDPKRRLISAAPFRDRVVHHALCNVIEPIFERTFSSASFANRLGKGTHRALDRAQNLARRYPYLLQFDIRQFFPAVDHEILLNILQRKIDDDGTLWLIRKILHSGREVLTDIYSPHCFPGDGPEHAVRPKGLPIGNLTSQFWANCYLNPLDHFIQRELRCKGYVRYVDDGLVFAEDKKKLRRWRKAIVDRLNKLRMTIHPDAHPRPVSEGFPFFKICAFSDPSPVETSQCGGLSATDEHPSCNRAKYFRG
jgi:retron-type reverse transcriptase